MSLLVWLPLLGNYNNQGLDDATFVLQSSTGTLVSSNNGKIGKCCEKATAKKSDRLRSSKTFNLDGDITIACWANVTETVGDTANGLITNHNHGDASGVSINVKQISASDYRISCSTGSGSGSRTYNTYYGTTNIKGAWHHLVLTYEKTAKQLKLWVDGQVEYTLNNYTNYAVANYIDIFSWSTGYNAGDYDPACKMNDVRVYDSCLSDREIEILSRGLVAHYPLNGGGRGGDNMLKNTNQGKTYWTWSAASGSRTVETYETTGVKMTVVEVGSSWNMWYYSGLVPSDIEPDTDYTVSVDILPPQNATIKCSIMQTNATNVICPTSDCTVIANVWNHAVFKLHSNSSFTPSGQVIYMNGIAPDTVGKTIYLKNLKLEKGSTATPWIPNSADTAYTAMGYNSTTEYDVSGYGNNGTKANITYSNNSARYSTSSTFNGSSSRIYIPNFSIGNEWSYGCWLRCNSLSGNWQAVAILNNTGGDADIQLGCYAYPTNSVFQSSANGKYNSGIACPHDTNWHYFFATYDGASLKTYVDGTLVATNSVTAALLARTNLTIGARCSGSGGSSFSNYFNGDLSDFRLYATALSATQVAELYNTAVSVANNGTLMGYELVES